MEVTREKVIKDLTTLIHNTSKLAVSALERGDKSLCDYYYDLSGKYQNALNILYSIR